ncbi:MAG: substrate-binding domain-containing protein [Anaerolineae bacterium]|nr:substrate-binding domain-containing protein [Anaerolineae bacterium]
MQQNNLKRFLMLALILTFALPFTSVSAQDPIELEEVDPLSVTGDIAIAGSSTVEPVTVAMAARFNDDGFMGNIAIAETGTSAGFERFCTEGSTDISNASRAIKSSEVEACAAIGRDILEFHIGTDAIAISVKAGSYVDQLKRSQLIAIFTGEVTTWDQVNPAWPADEIKLYIPGVDSGTFDFFGEAVLGTKGMYSEREDRFAALLEPAPTTSENDYTLVEGIIGSEGAIGYFGFAYYVENADELQAVAIANDVKNDDEGNLVVIPEDEWAAAGIDYVAPTSDTAQSGEYMLSRPLFIYSAKSVFAEKPQVMAFVQYYLANAEEVVLEVGYFPIDVASMNATKQIFLDAVAELQ